jgi:alpha-ketoglutarate-dependent taurine dioxygenase
VHQPNQLLWHDKYLIFSLTHPARRLDAVNQQGHHHDHRQPYRQALGAEISGVDLSKPLADDTFAQVAKPFSTTRSFFFRNQKLAPENQIDFTRRFGVLEQHVRKESRLSEFPEILVVSNLLDKHGNAIGTQDAGRFWHSDLSYKREPSMLSALYAVEVPVQNGRTLGDTNFASTTCRLRRAARGDEAALARPQERTQLPLLPQQECARTERGRSTRRARHTGARADGSAIEQRARRGDSDRAYPPGDQTQRTVRQ